MKIENLYLMGNLLISMRIGQRLKAGHFYLHPF